MRGAKHIAVGDFDLEASLNSGQAFHWERGEEGAFYGCIGDVPVRLAQVKPREVEVSEEAEGIAFDYLGLGDSIDEIKSGFPQSDVALESAVAFAPGLRILRQPSWECLATFITSSLKQVAHIRQISLRLRKRFGTRHEVGGRDVYSYPVPESLAAAGEAALRECGLGYRAKNIHAAAERLASGEVSLVRMAALDANEELCEALCRFHGVGEKIAACVMLFGFGRLDAFPVDVWIERTLRENYGDSLGEKASLQRLREFARAHFGPYGGYAQQFLFHHARCGGD
jgi:N-glycosylase/DNA lyase